MVGPQSPTFQIFSPAQAVSAANVAAEGFCPIAAIEANHIIGTYRLANRDYRGECFFGRGLLPKLTEASVEADLLRLYGVASNSQRFSRSVADDRLWIPWQSPRHDFLLRLINPHGDSRIFNFVIRNEARDYHRLRLRNVSRSRLTHPACSRRGTELPCHVP